MLGLKQLGGRLAQLVFVLWAVATILFLMFRLMPGNPLAAYIDPTFTEEQQAILMAKFGLDRPLWEQYFIYLCNLAQGELGDSFFNRQPLLILCQTSEIDRRDGDPSLREMIEQSRVRFSGRVTAGIFLIRGQLEIDLPEPHHGARQFFEGTPPP